MKVTVLSVARVNDVNEDEEFEVQLRVGDRICYGRLKRQGSLPIWHSDSALYKCLEHMPMAPRCVNQVVADVRSGKDISFPVEVGDF